MGPSNITAHAVVGPSAGRTWWPLLGAAAGYLVASIALTWPLVLQLDQLLFGDYGDTRGSVWWVWAKASGHLDAPILPYLAAPYGMATARVFSHPVTDSSLVLLARMVGEIAATNLFVLLAFPSTALGTFVLVRRLVRDDGAALLAGFVFGFCPAAVLQAAGGHALYAFNAFIPLFLLALFHNRERRTWRSALAVAVAFAAICFTALYFGYFSIYIALFFVAFDLLTRHTQELRPIARNYALCAAFAAAIVVPVEFAAVYEQLSAPREMIERSGHIRGFDELGIYASRFWDFLLPSIDHPVLGARIEDFARGNLHGSNLFEQTLYLGWIPIGLLGAGIIMALRSAFDERHRELFAFFAWGAAVMYFLSLPPIVGGGVPTASFFAYAMAPMFRVYARFGILVNLFVACAGAVVLSQWRQCAPAAQRAILALLLPALVFEYWSVPPGYARPVAEAPEVYRWLARQPGDIVVAEYPMIASDEAAYYTYPFWQRVHGKRLVNGASRADPRAWALFEQVRDLANPHTPALLRDAGVRYVIVHKAMYRDGPIPEPIKRYYPPDRAAQTGKPPPIPAQLRFVEAFGPDWVYALCSEDC